MVQLVVRNMGTVYAYRAMCPEDYETVSEEYFAVSYKEIGNITRDTPYMKAGSTPESGQSNGL